EFLDYINDIDPELSNNIGYTRSTSLNLFRKIDDTVEQVSFSNASPDNEQTNAMMSAMSASTGIGVSTFPEQLSEDNGNFLKDNYDLLEGSYPSASTDVVLIVDENNVTNVNALINLGFDIEDGDKVSFDDIVGTKITLASNDAFYTELPTGNFIPNQDLNDVFDNSNNKELTISGILRIKQNSTMNLLSTGIAYSDALAQEVIKENQDSAIVQAQKDSDTNVMTNEPVDESAKDSLIAYLGGSDLPNSIMIYPNDFSAKEKILDYLDDFNKGKDKEDQIVYSDLAGTMTQLTGGLMDAITYVLIAFAGISLVTSMIMIGIITYISVLERTKEIGILRAIGASKRNISSIFNAETSIIGLLS
ncbi:MAG: ABC transporter permease, partial [Enterococcus casseliflavus]